MSEHLRIGDAERDRAAAELAEHYAQGRLTTEEHAERLDRIWAARTGAELGPVFADLPGPHHGPPPAPYAVRRAYAGAVPRSAGGRRFRGLPLPLVALLVVLAAVAVVAHLPLILGGLLVWCLLTRRGSCGRGQRTRWS